MDACGVGIIGVNYTGGGDGMTDGDHGARLAAARSAGRLVGMNHVRTNRSTLTAKLVLIIPMVLLPQ